MSYHPDDSTSGPPAASAIAAEPTGLEITITPTCYWVSALPETDRAAPACTITVEYRAAARQWLICRFGECLSHDGAWHLKPHDSRCDATWWSTHGHHDLQAALDLACRILPGLPACVHGLTVAQLVAQRRPR